MQGHGVLQLNSGSRVASGQFGDLGLIKDVYIIPKTFIPKKKINISCNKDSLVINTESLA